MAVYGYFLYAFGPTVPLLREEQRSSLTVAGLHGTALAVGALVAGSVSPALTRRWGRGVVVWGGTASLVAGVLMYTAFLALAGTLGGAALCGLGGSLIINASAGILGDLHGDLAAASITEANALTSGIGTVAPLLVALAASTALGWRAAPLLVVALAVVLLAVFARTRVPPVVAPPEHGGSGRLPGRYWILWVVLVASIAAEFCVTLWCADLLRSRDGVALERAGIGVTAVVVGITLGRLIGARAALRHPVTTLLLVGTATSAVGFAAFWLTTSAVVAFAGLAVVGLGISVLYPSAISLAIAASGGRTDLATGRASFAAALAVGGGPFLLGAIGDQVGIHRAFLVVPVLLAVAAGGVLLEQRLARRDRR
jgi:predicted MFS family arabinose efflux permease